MVDVAEPGPSLRIEILDDEIAVGRRVAGLIAAAVRAEPEAVIGLATGAPPEPAYRELVSRSDRGELDLSRVTVFLLDEYVGLPHEHPASYHATIPRELTDAVGWRVRSARRAPPRSCGVTPMPG